MKVTVKTSKTDPLERMRPVSRMVRDRSVPSDSSIRLPGGERTWTRPMFKLKDRCFLTRKRVVVALRKLLQVAGLDCTKYCGHIGVATMAAKKGMEDAMIKCWEGGGA